MKEVGVYVWWSAGRGDGDGYDETIEVTDEQYEILKELEVDGEALNEIEDPRIKELCYSKYEELIDELYGNSIEYEEENYREDCLIDPDSDEYDPEGEEEQFTMSLEEWWFDNYEVGASFSHDFDEENPYIKF